MENIGLYLMLLLFAIPSFALILSTKCVDLYSYKKLYAINNIKRFLIMEFLILLVAQLLNAVVQCFIWENVKIPEILVLVFPTSLISIPMLLLIPIYILERKGVAKLQQKYSLQTKSFVTDILLCFGYNVALMLIFLLSLPELDAVCIAGVIALLALFVFIKIEIQKHIVKRLSRGTEGCPSQQGE